MWLATPYRVFGNQPAIKADSRHQSVIDNHKLIEEMLALFGKQNLHRHSALRNRQCLKSNV